MDVGGSWIADMAWVRRELLKRYLSWRSEPHSEVLGESFHVHGAKMLAITSCESLQARLLYACCLRK